MIITNVLLLLHTYYYYYYYTLYGKLGFVDS